MALSSVGGSLLDAVVQHLRQRPSLHDITREELLGVAERPVALALSSATGPTTVGELIFDQWCETIVKLAAATALDEPAGPQSRHVAAAYAHGVVGLCATAQQYDIRLPTLEASMGALAKRAGTLAPTDLAAAVAYLADVANSSGSLCALQPVAAVSIRYMVEQQRGSSLVATGVVGRIDEVRTSISTSRKLFELFREGGCDAAIGDDVLRALVLAPIREYVVSRLVATVTSSSEGGVAPRDLRLPIVSEFSAAFSDACADLTTAFGPLLGRSLRLEVLAACLAAASSSVSASLTFNVGVVECLASLVSTSSASITPELLSLLGELEPLLHATQTAGALHLRAAHLQKSNTGVQRSVDVAAQLCAASCDAAAFASTYEAAFARRCLAFFAVNECRAGATISPSPSSLRDTHSIPRVVSRALGSAVGHHLAVCEREATHPGTVGGNRVLFMSSHVWPQSFRSLTMHDGAASSSVGVPPRLAFRQLPQQQSTGVTTDRVPLEVALSATRALHTLLKATVAAEPRITACHAQLLPATTSGAPRKYALVPYLATFFTAFSAGGSKLPQRTTPRWFSAHELAALIALSALTKTGATADAADVVALSILILHGAASWLLHPSPVLETSTAADAAQQSPTEVAPSRRNAAAALGMDSDVEENVSASPIASRTIAPTIVVKTPPALPADSHVQVVSDIPRVDTMTQALAALVDRSIVSCSPDAADSRIQRISLVPAPAPADHRDRHEEGAPVQWCGLREHPLLAVASAGRPRPARGTGGGPNKAEQAKREAALVVALKRAQPAWTSTSQLASSIDVTAAAAAKLLDALAVRGLCERSPSSTDSSDAQWRYVP
jgi:hypothetical protein